MHRFTFLIAAAFLAGRPSSAFAAAYYPVEPQADEALGTLVSGERS
jgi:hypothetical protein